MMKRNRFLVPSVVFFFGVPAIVLLHELSHWEVASFYDMQPVLHTTSVDVSQVTILLGEEEMWDKKNFRFTLAGPAVEFTLAVLGTVALLFVARDSKPTARPSLIFWIATLCCFAGLRWFKTLWSGRDEWYLSEKMGLAPHSLPLMMLPISLFVLVFLIRTHVRTGTVTEFGVAFLSGILGVTLWIWVVGPMILGS